ncbi:MAG: Asp-tRNA(Asn)/Glu-tRNA(Gln) amidotransferase subunit GatB [Chitinivibrionales bacterium]|nr:Asp-tRNA(Asn)/Glu-tRNA(Gln) amidotransferase subunit GatB [Chitinivibrionales bacterium]
MEFETVIGLEVHAQLKTNTKIFCSCKPMFGDDANTHGCPVCLGLPGALPVLNRHAVEMAMLMGEAVHCTIAQKSIFARKNYFYPDLPKGYQISQYELPLCENGAITVHVNGAEKKIRILRIHLEEDAGKLIHDQDEDSLFDVNRCGTPLIEIVTEPDMRSPQEAYAYLAGMKRILQYLDICDCNMEEGSLRCDANISLRPKGETKLGTKTELKNMNSFRGVEKALESERLRQQEVLESGGQIRQETYLWDAQKNRTVAMRTKEHAHDYRYFPDPDLVPLIIDKEWADSVKENLPELPEARKERFMQQMNLTEEHAEILTDTREVADYFEEVLKSCGDARMAATWVMGEVLRIAKDKKTGLKELNVTPWRLGHLLGLVKDGAVSANAAKKVFAEIQNRNADPGALIDEMGLKQISDTSELKRITEDIIAQHPDEAKRYKEGEKKLSGFFIGQVMKATRGKGNPKEINKLVSGLLG